MIAFPKFTLGLARCSSNVGAAGSRGFVKEAKSTLKGASEYLNLDTKVERAREFIMTNEERSSLGSG